MTRFACLLLGIGVSGGAWAQDAHNFFAAPFDGDIRDPLTFHRPGALHQGEFSIGAIVDYARQPLVVVIRPENGGEESRIPLLDHLLALDLSVSIAVHDHLRFVAAAPFYGFSYGRSVDDAGGTVSVTSESEFSGPTVGDTRLSAVGLIIRPEHITTGGGFGLGVEAHIDLPSGNQNRFLGRDAFGCCAGIGGGGSVIATYEVDWFTLSGSVGTQFDPGSDVAPNWTGDDVLNTSIDLGFGASQASGFHLEARRFTPYSASTYKGSSAASEVIGSYRYRAHSGLFMVVGLGAGLSQGVGAARYRAFLGMGWGNMPDRRPPDMDGIGAFEASDTCPGETETDNGYQDDDGCADTLGTVVVRASKDGTAMEGAFVDLHGEGFVGQSVMTTAEETVVTEVMPGIGLFGKAKVGACLEGESSIQVDAGENVLDVPLVAVHPAKVKVAVWDPDGNPISSANVFWRVEDRNCAPPMATAVDAEGTMTTPIGVGPAHLLVTASEFNDHDADYAFENGDDRTINVTLTPVKKKVTRVRLEKKRIVILEKVHFEFNKAIIQPDSFPLLNDVADTIITNPQVGRVEVSGHTDAKGSDSYNQTLSQDRSASVREYLIGRGVDPERLLAMGYGESAPIADNETEEGREANRRVEFNLIDQVDEPDPGTDDIDVPGGTP